MAASFQPFDLGSVLRNAETIRAMRDNTATASLQREYMRTVRMPNEQAEAQRAGAQEARASAQEGRAETNFNREQGLEALRMLNAASAEIAENPAAAARWMPTLRKAGLPEELLAQPLDQAAAKQLFASTSKALQAYTQSGTNRRVQSTKVGENGNIWQVYSDGTMLDTGVKAAPTNAVQFREIQLPDGRVVQGTQDPNTGAIFGMDGSMLAPGVRGGGPAGAAAQPVSAPPGLGTSRTPEEAAAAKKRAETQVENAGALPDELSDIDTMRTNVKGLLDAPGFDTIYGLAGAVDLRNRIPGTDAANAAARREQIDAQAFQIAIQKMRGLGALSNAEGSKVGAAFTRATNPNISAEEARDAWGEVLTYLELAQMRALTRAGKAPAPNAPAPMNTSTGPFQIQSDADYDSLPSGAEFVDPDGRLRRKP